MNTYKTKGTCSSNIHFNVDNNILTDVEFVSGCPGNLIGIKNLVEGQPIDQIIQRLKGIPCGSKSTSCPDQLALALEEYIANHE
jgi:uncharacterized protein (TIGR03905 family)